MNEKYLWRVRGPWTNDDWLLASDIPAAEMESREKCEVSIIYWSSDEAEMDLTEDQVNSPGVNDYVEVQAYARRREELARGRGRKNAEVAFDNSRSSK